MFSTGIETSYPTISVDGRSVRVDEMEKCGHYQRWREDFELVREMGIDYLRYGPPLYSTFVGPGKYDWSFVDETLNVLRDLKITPIVDLCHFGVPDWLGNFQNPDFHGYFSEYAAAFSKRYPWITLFTPINEIFIAATFSALLGWWNERLTSDRAYVNALKNLCKANVAAMHGILHTQPNAVFIQSETSEYFHAEQPSCTNGAKFFNERRFIPLDLTYGHPINATIYEYLLDNGMTRQEYHWFLDNHVKEHCVMGNDYYITNEHLLKADGSIIPSGEIFGYYVITHQYFARYGLRVMHTETNLKDNEGAPNWLRKEWANVHRLKQDGVPILGFTWYSLTDQVDWDSALRENAGQVNPCGLFDLNRKIRPVGTGYKRLLGLWKDVLPSECI